MARAPEYDRDTVVQQAMAVFWERGYSQTSVCDLVEATGLKPGSLYAAFGNKKGVYLEVLQQYNRHFLDRIDALGRGRTSTLEDLNALLRDIVEDTVSGRDQRGCLSVNALLEMASHDDDVAKRLARYNERIGAAFTNVVERAKSDGDVDKNRDAAAVAAFLVNNIWGMRVMCKGKPDRKAMTAIVDVVMASLRR